MRLSSLLSSRSSLSSSLLSSRSSLPSSLLSTFYEGSNEGHFKMKTWEIRRTPRRKCALWRQRERERAEGDFIYGNMAFSLLKITNPSTFTPPRHSPTASSHHPTVSSLQHPSPNALITHHPSPLQPWPNLMVARR